MVMKHKVTLRHATMAATQLGALALLSEVGYSIADRWGAPVPGNLLGMLILLALLLTGVLKLDWIEAGASLLVRHLAFFFVPITVGLMGFTSLFLDHGWALLATVIASTVVGIGVAGFSSQRLGCRSVKTQP